MTLALLVLLIAVCASFLVWGFSRPDRMLQYPFLAGAVFAGWALPQLIGLTNNEGLPEGAIDRTLAMTILCALAIYAGNAAARPMRLLDWQFDRQRMLLAATVLSLVGAFFFFQVSRLAEEAMSLYGGAWTGPITIYVFLSTTLTVGMVLALQIFMRRPSLWPALIVAADLLFYLDRIVFQGRRAVAAELVIILALTLWFHRRLAPARWAMAAVLVLGTLWVNSVGEYRSLVMAGPQYGLTTIGDIDFLGNFEEILSRGGNSMTNAVYDIEATARLNWYDFGLYHWNELVTFTVPGQIVGHDLKDALMFDTKGSAALEAFRHVPHTGSTHTGMSDAFGSFWYFGALKFFLIALIMAKLYRAGLRGHFVAQALLMLVYVDALQAITHGTGPFFTVWPSLVAFMGPALLYARKTSPMARMPQASMAQAS